jgi:hypothetical protein
MVTFMDRWTVSIVTVTQGTRVPFFKIQVENLGKQTYEHILEWVIVDGSATAEESAALQYQLLELHFPRELRIVYYPWNPTRPKIGKLRNIANQLASGQIIVNIDDDDYYSPHYVQHAVTTLRTSPKKAQVAGCGAAYVYDMRWHTVFQAKLFNDNHTCNNTIAFSKKFAQSNFYDETVDFAEENRFLKWPGGVLVEQMDPIICGVHLCHGKNTYNKQTIMLGALCDIESGAYRDTTKKINDVMPADILVKYEALRGPPPRCPYDIVVFCGGWYDEWDPTSSELPEAENAVVQLATRWAAQGFRVAVYGTLAVVGPRFGVMYFGTMDFDPYQAFNILVLWRNYAIYPISNMQAPLSVNKLIIDLHDNLEVSYHAVKRILHITYYLDRVHVVFKSAFHKSEYETICGPIPPDVFSIIPSGIDLPPPALIPAPASAPARLPWRFCYSLDYRRGLAEILEHLWPQVIALDPRAELHVFLPDNLQDVTNCKIKYLIAKTKGVCNHGKQPAAIVALEKQVSMFELAISDARGDVDCVSIKQSAAMGCTPFLLNTHVYREIDGIHFDPSMSYLTLAKTIVECINTHTQPLYQFKSQPQPSWDDVCRVWINRCF